MSRVVILTLHSLFVEGVAARLRQHFPANEIQAVDAGEPAALSQVIVAKPAFVILAETDNDVECLVSALLNTLTTVTVLRLDPEHDHIQVVTSKQQTVGHLRELVEMIGSIT